MLKEGSIGLQKTSGNHDSEEGLNGRPTLRPLPWRAGRGQTGDGWGRDGGSHLVPKNEAGQKVKTRQVIPGKVGLVANTGN